MAERGSEITRGELESLCLSVEATTSQETATKQPWQSHTLPQRNNRQQLEAATEKLQEKERWVGKKSETDGES